MMRFMLLFSRQGKLRLQKWYLATSDKERKKMVRELMQVVLARKPKMCSFLEWRDLKVVYKRYASLYFCCAIEGQDNELITLELIHRYVELLDKYFGSVCELDIIFNFEKAYFILDEFLMGGDVQDTSKKSVLKAIEQADLLQEEKHFWTLPGLGSVKEGRAAAISQDAKAALPVPLIPGTRVARFKAKKKKKRKIPSSICYDNDNVFRISVSCANVFIVYLECKFD
uniref:Adaptor related protein complex 1 subunit sigma 1 n=1 Tax=Balaenoptera musculus TaxID=9771 RepID=A0A8C0D242_BALMU